MSLTFSLVLGLSGVLLKLWYALFLLVLGPVVVWAPLKQCAPEDLQSNLRSKKKKKIHVYIFFKMLILLYLHPLISVHQWNPNRSPVDIWNMLSSQSLFYDVSHSITVLYVSPLIFCLSPYQLPVYTWINSPHSLTSFEG